MTLKTVTHTRMIQETYTQPEVYAYDETTARRDPSYRPYLRFMPIDQSPNFTVECYSPGNPNVYVTLTRNQVMELYADLAHLIKLTASSSEPPAASAPPPPSSDPVP